MDHYQQPQPQPQPQRRRQRTKKIPTKTQFCCSQCKEQFTDSDTMHQHFERVHNFKQAFLNSCLATNIDIVSTNNNPIEMNQNNYYAVPNAYFPSQAGRSECNELNFQTNVKMQYRPTSKLTDDGQQVVPIAPVPISWAPTPTYIPQSQDRNIMLGSKFIAPMRSANMHQFDCNTTTSSNFKVDEQMTTNTANPEDKIRSNETYHVQWGSLSVPTSTKNFAQPATTCTKPTFEILGEEQFPFADMQTSDTFLEEQYWTNEQNPTSPLKASTKKQFEMTDTIPKSQNKEYEQFQNTDTVSPSQCMSPLSNQIEYSNLSAIDVMRKLTIPNDSKCNPKASDNDHISTFPAVYHSQSNNSSTPTYFNFPPATNITSTSSHQQEYSSSMEESNLQIANESPIATHSPSICPTSNNNYVPAPMNFLRGVDSRSFHYHPYKSLPYIGPPPTSPNVYDPKTVTIIDLDFALKVQNLMRNRWMGYASNQLSPGLSPYHYPLPHYDGRYNYGSHSYLPQNNNSNQ